MITATQASRRLAFEIPRVPPDIANQRVDWTVRNQQRKEWIRDVTWQARIQLRTWPKAMEGERRKVRVTQYRVRVMDRGNRYHS